MEFNSKIEKIKSKYIHLKIFEFIKDENFKFKLYLYSKLFQKKLELGMIDFKERYVNQTKINFDNYLCCFSLFNLDQKNFDKNLMNKKLKEDLQKFNLNIELIHEYLLNDLKKIVDKLKEKEKENKLQLNKF